MQVSQRHVVDARELCRRNGFHSPYRNGPLRFGALATDHERVRKNDRAGVRSCVRPDHEIGTNTRHGGVQNVGVRPRLRHTEFRATCFGLEIRDAVERHLAVGIVEHEGPVDATHRGEQVQSTGCGERCARTQPRW